MTINLLKQFKRREIIILICIVVLAGILRFWNSGGLDVQSDHAINSYRALGWFDYLGDRQTTPLTWFSALPWWSHLSFHDHPPLVFAIQKIFFIVFGDTGLGAHIPFVISGICSVLVIFLIIRLLTNQRAALIGSGLYAISSYSVWASRAGYLEGIQELFIILSVYFVIRYLQKEKRVDLYLLFIATACAFLSKYTSIFLIPAGIVVFTVYKRSVFIKKDFWMGVVLFFVLLTPVIIYNTMLFETRGHFDAALSSMLGMHPVDFGSIAERSISSNLVGSAIAQVRTLYANCSLPYVLLLGISFVYACFRWYRLKNTIQASVLVYAFMAIILFLFSGASTRFYSIMMPFLIIIASLILDNVYQEMRSRRLKKFGIVIMIVIAGCELFFSINTNVLANPIGPIGMLYAKDRLYDQGYERLDQYLRSSVYGSLPGVRQIQSLKDSVFNLDASRGKIVFFDERIDWFESMWYIRRYQHFFELPVIDFMHFGQVIKKEEASFGEVLAILYAKGINKVWFVRVADDFVEPKRDDEYSQSIRAFAQQLEAAGIQPVNIKNYANKTVFLVYKFEIH